MGCKQMMDRMTFVMYGEDLCRVEITENAKGEKIISVDLHGLNKKNASKILRNIIAMYQFPFCLVLIHGYNHGTVLKELIWNELNNERISSKMTPDYNPGITYLSIK